MKVMGYSSSVYPEKVGGLISMSVISDCCSGGLLVLLSLSLSSANSSRVNCCRASIIGVGGSDSLSGFQGAYSSSYQLSAIIDGFSGSESEVSRLLVWSVVRFQPKGEVDVKSEWSPANGHQM